MKSHIHLLIKLSLIATACLFAGCTGGRVPLTGKVVYEDGSPVVEGTLIGEGTIDGKAVSVQGIIERDGTFKVGTKLPGDGALPGEYKFIIMPPALGDSELAEGKKPAVAGKYTNFETADIHYQVLNDQKNEMEIIVSKPQ